MQWEMESWRSRDIDDSLSQLVVPLRCFLEREDAALLVLQR